MDGSNDQRRCLMKSLPLLFTFVSATVACSLLTHWVRGHALRRHMLDIPNSRSSHVVPTPRGGGVAIVLVVCVALLGIALWDPERRILAFLIAMAGFAVAAVGYLDDQRGVSAWKRLATHTLGVATVLFATSDLGPLEMPGLPAVPALHWAVALLSLVWLLNLFNFMDGIDGIAAMEAAFVSLALAGCLYFGAGAFGPAMALSVTLAGASLGFLAHNWPPARIFMGDVGSGFLGLMLGALALLAHRAEGIDVRIIGILLATFVTDATVTLVRRILRGEKWHEAHRSHAYQWLSRRCDSHLAVTLGALAINVGWLFPLALLASRRQQDAWALCMLAYLPLVAFAIYAGAGRAETTMVRE